MRKNDTTAPKEASPGEFKLSAIPCGSLCQNLPARENGGSPAECDLLGPPTLRGARVSAGPPARMPSTEGDLRRGARDSRADRGLRADLIRRVRAEINAGCYLSEHKISRAVARLQSAFGQMVRSSRRHEESIV